MQHHANAYRLVAEGDLPGLHRPEIRSTLLHSYLGYRRYTMIESEFVRYVLAGPAVGGAVRKNFKKSWAPAAFHSEALPSGITRDGVVTPISKNN